MPLPEVGLGLGRGRARCSALHHHLSKDMVFAACRAHVAGGRPPSPFLIDMDPEIPARASPLFWKTRTCDGQCDPRPKLACLAGGSTLAQLPIAGRCCLGACCLLTDDAARTKADKLTKLSRSGNGYAVRIT